ncbi:MAG TPA: nucleotide excision repair endonuclease [Vicinamibacterales bacterium]|nr:nucleotide excision repair endonuclease [Vicinamibacterales bacterium]
MSLLRDRLMARLAGMGPAPDHQRLASEVLGIRGASPELARRLVAQALVLEDRRDAWRRAGERICREAPAAPGIYILKDTAGRPLYVGKATNLRRRLRAHFAERRWRAIKPEMARAADAEWQEVGSELEALLREAALIAELQPPVNVQTGAPDLDARAVPHTLVRDVVVLLPSIEADSVELIAAAADGRTMIQQTRRSGDDLAVHTQRIMRFFNSALARGRSGAAGAASAPIVFSWLAQRGETATRVDPHDVRSPRELRTRLAALFRDERLFHERLHQC